MSAIDKDADSDGKLNRDQWFKVLNEAGYANSSSDVEKMFTTKDKDLDGKLSFEEFMGEKSRAEKLFKLMDKDGDGFVTKSEFRTVCKNLDKAQVETAFKKFDQTGNDKLNYKEFCDMMNKKGMERGDTVKRPAMQKQSSNQELLAKTPESTANPLVERSSTSMDS